MKQIIPFKVIGTILKQEQNMLCNNKFTLRKIDILHHVHCFNITLIQIDISKVAFLTVYALGKNSRNQQLLDILACNSANSAVIQNNAHIQGVVHFIAQVKGHVQTIQNSRFNDKHCQGIGKKIFFTDNKSKIS